MSCLLVAVFLMFLLLLLTGRIRLPSIYRTVHGGVGDLAETGSAPAPLNPWLEVCAWKWLPTWRGETWVLVRPQHLESSFPPSVKRRLVLPPSLVMRLMGHVGESIVDWDELSQCYFCQVLWETECWAPPRLPSLDPGPGHVCCFGKYMWADTLSVACKPYSSIGPDHKNIIASGCFRCS